MVMKKQRVLWVGLMMLACVFSAHAAKAPSVKEALEKAGKPAWTFKGTNDTLKVSVSPAGRLLKLIPRGGGVLGRAVDIAMNDKYRAAIKEALGDYDLADAVMKRIEERLKEIAPETLTHLPPMRSTAGISNDREAEAARFEALDKMGIDLLMDLQMDYGVYTENFELQFVVKGKVLQLPKKKRLWRESIPVTIEPYLANVKFKNMLLDQVPFSRPPRLRVNQEAAAKITDDDAAWFRAQFEKAADAAVSAVLCSLGLTHDARGEYYMGRKAFQEKDFKEAQERLESALKQDPEMTGAINDLSVTLAHRKEYDKAIALAQQILDKNPEYGPAAFNLAWWYALDKRQPAEAQKAYDRARALGMPENKKIEKAIKKATK